MSLFPIWGVLFHPFLNEAQWLFFVVAAQEVQKNDPALRSIVSLKVNGWGSSFVSFKVPLKLCKCVTHSHYIITDYD